MRKLNTTVLLVLAMLMQLGLDAQSAVSQLVNLSSTAKNRSSLITHHPLFGTLEWTNSEVLNSSQKDFSPVFYNKGIVFPSTRKGKRKSSNTSNKYLYARMNSEGHIRATRSFDAGIKAFNVQGPISFSPSGLTLFFAEKQGRGVNDMATYHLSFIQKTKAGWGKQKQLPLNVDGYTSTHPFLNQKGTKLFFASDQPGGYGGMDIYVSYYDNGIWSEAINLGPEVNTAEDEAYPVIGEDGQLYFASKRAGGEGGLDLYVANEKRNSEISLWGQVESLGSPFNSAYDDFGFLLNKTFTGGFFSSNRPGGKGDVDIYAWDITERLHNQPVAKINVKPQEQIEDKPEKQRVIELNPTREKITEEEMQLLVYEAYIDKLTKELTGEESTSVVEETISTPAENVALKAKAEKQIVKQSQFVTGQKIHFSNLNGRGANSDFAQSELDYIIKMMQENPGMQVGLSKNDRMVNLTKVKSLLLDNGIMASRIKNQTTEGNPYINEGMSVEVLRMNAEFAKAVSTSDYEASSAAMEMAASEENYALASYDNIMMERLKMGKGAKLSKVHYGYNQHELDKESMAELDDIVALMKQYSSMQIGLYGHTDSFGGNAYNLKLSQKRASFVKAYMVARGISPARLLLKAKGETDLIYNCEMTNNCTKDNQRINRRTELILLNVNMEEVTGL